MLIVRPAGPADIDMLMELAVLSGRGFTSLPEDEAVLSERLALSETSFAGTVAPADSWYTIMLEDTETGRVEGVASIRAAIGLKRPHFSFRVMTLAQYSSAIQTRFDHQALVLVNECSGWTEVGSLFLRPERRSGGAGSLLARARYMLIGSEPERFSRTIMAELRGWFDDAGQSPFWEGVASKFYRLPFAEADRMVTSTDGQFILDLAPRHPIFVELIDAAACDAIGKVHNDGRAARALLEREGFEYTNLIDIFDGGPTMTCQRESLSTIRENQIVRFAIGDPSGVPMLISTSKIASFRGTRAAADVGDGVAVIALSTAQALGLKADDLLVISK
jgi:arginine N-succinyltransferase